MTDNDDADSTGTVTLGDELTYTITVTNTGNTTLNNVTIIDTKISPNSTSCTTLLQGATCVLVGTYTVTEADVLAGFVLNTATGDSDETDSVDDTVKTPVECIQPYAGENGFLTICKGDIVTESQLFAVLGGTPDEGGTWSPVIGGAELEVGDHIFTYTVTSLCTDDDSATVTVTVDPCDFESYCSYTQGFYGNQGGKGCTPEDGLSDAYHMMYAAVDAQPGDLYEFGAGTNIFTLYLDDIVNKSIFKMLPGGGKAKALTGSATYSDGSSWGYVPLVTKGKKKIGSIKNILLAQTMTLFFNIELNDRLGNWELQSEFYTSALKSCGAEEAYPETETFYIDQSVIDYLGSDATVSGLFDLANKALGGNKDLSLSAINNAVDAINRGFDECRVLKDRPYPDTDNKSSISKTTVDPYPLPFANALNLKMGIAYDTKVQVQLYDMLGRLVLTSDNMDVISGSSTLQVDLGENLAEGHYILRVITAKEVITKRVICKK